MVLVVGLIKRIGRRYKVLRHPGRRAAAAGLELRELFATPARLPNPGYDRSDKGPKGWVWQGNWSAGCQAVSHGDLQP